ncbi:MAG: sulfite exporter TauE/SafE family protein [Bauldia litoralis]|uniref:sulfite exporter TauE/SafE family protein n=1 Tax=Bauldia litoralis TaxID=665467 RepID=UPI0032997CA9
MSDLTLLQDVLALLSGGLVGFSLGLVGGGGSVLAVPLLVYVVGVKDPHTAIGTSALAVAVSAAINLVTHFRKGNVKFGCAAAFAVFGIIGAALGSTAGKAFDGQSLLALFGVVMIVVGLTMARKPAEVGRPDIHLDRSTAANLLPRIAPVALGVGFMAGFFGIGGGFLIVPSLVAATGMTMLNAIGTSLVAITAFGLTTALNYALSGYVDWPLALVFIAGGLAGGVAGAYIARWLSGRKGALDIAFAGLIMLVAIYMLVKSGLAFLG